MKAYAGIGSRETPQEVLNDMELFAFLASRHLLLRSGAAPGADTAFEKGCTKGAGASKIFLPWKNFNKSGSSLYQVHPTALALAENVHPHFKHMRRPVKLLIARNMHQVLGLSLNDPVEFVVCWTKDGCESHQTYNPSKTGGTGSAIALASKCNIPVYNIFNQGRLNAAYDHLESLRVDLLGGE